MAVLPKKAVPNVPWQQDPRIFYKDSNGTINVGDFLEFSGRAVIPTDALNWTSKGSAAGIALDSNPTYDQHGVAIHNSAMGVLRAGVIRVSAQFTAEGSAGWGAYPATTGSALYQRTGVTGIPAYWQQTAPARYSGATGIINRSVGIVLNSFDWGAATSGSLDVLLNINGEPGWV